MTAPAPQPQPRRSSLAAPGRASASVAPAQAPASGPASAAAATARLPRVVRPSTTTSRLRLARGVAAAACLVPGIVGMVDIAGAAGAPVASPAQTYADIRTSAARFEAEAAVAAVPGSTGVAAAGKALTDTSARLGATALLYPARSQELYAVNDALAQRQSALTAAYGARASATPGMPAGDEAYRTALHTLDDPPSASSSGGTLRVLGAGILAGLALAGVSVWLAPRTKRVVNVGLAGALLVTVGATALGVSVLGSPGASAVVDDLARLRAEAAGSVAAEAMALQRGASAESALHTQAKHLAAGQRIVEPSVSGKPSTAAAWAAFTRGALSDAQLKGGVTQSTASLVKDRIAALDTLTGTLSQRARAAGEGTDPRPSLLAGYGVFGLSLLAGAAAWTGVGRRLEEYR